MVKAQARRILVMAAAAALAVGAIQSAHATATDAQMGARVSKSRRFPAVRKVPYSPTTSIMASVKPELDLGPSET